MLCLKCLLPLELTSAHYGLHAKCFETWFKAPATAQFSSLTRQHSYSYKPVAKFSSQNTSFFHGRFKKYSAELEGHSYILKMREAEAPELPEVEYLCNQIGSLLEIPMAEFYIVNFEGDNVFVTKNFIRPIAPIDLQHIYHFRPDDHHHCEGLIKVISEKTQRPHDVWVLVNTILFDALIGNHDRHGRNLALITMAESILLAPIYDNVSYLSLEKGHMLKADFNPTGKIGTFATNEPSMKDYAKELKRLGYQEQVAVFYHKANLLQLENLIQASFCSDLMKRAMTRLIKKRHEELEDELNA